MATSWKTRQKIAKAIDARESFKIGNISGRWLDESNITDHFGILPLEYRKSLQDRLETSDVYVIYSYNTPIAYSHDLKHDFVIPDVQYSRTTTHHQGVVAVSILPDSPYLL